MGGGETGSGACARPPPRSVARSRAPTAAALLRGPPAAFPPAAAPSEGRAAARRAGQSDPALLLRRFVSRSAAGRWRRPACPCHGGGPRAALAVRRARGSKDTTPGPPVPKRATAPGCGVYFKSCRCCLCTQITSGETLGLSGYEVLAVACEGKRGVCGKKVVNYEIQAVASFPL